MFKLKRQKQFSSNELIALKGICRDIMNKNIKNTTTKDAQYFYSKIAVTTENKAEITKGIYDEL